MRPTSIATSYGTGMSDPTQLGTDPTSRASSTRISSSRISTILQVLPLAMNMAYSSAKDATKLSSSVPMTARVPMSRIMYERSSGIIEMFS